MIILWFFLKATGGSFSFYMYLQRRVYLLEVVFAAIFTNVSVGKQVISDIKQALVNIFECVRMLFYLCVDLGKKFVDRALEENIDKIRNVQNRRKEVPVLYLIEDRPLWIDTSILSKEEFRA